MGGLVVSLLFVWALTSMVGFSQGKDVVICEHSRGKSLQCEEGEEIHVLVAKWGGHKNKKICKSHKDCKKTVDRLSTVKKLCQSRQFCKLRPHYKEFGDECPGVTKYLDVRYICKRVGCNADQMQCDTNRCISLTWKCDGAKDCADGKDELQCQNVKPTKKSCFMGQFQCTSSEKCISIGWRCDGNRDCDDNSDEMNCGKAATTTRRVTTRQRTLKPTKPTTTQPTTTLPTMPSTLPTTQLPSTGKPVTTETTAHAPTTPRLSTKISTAAPCPSGTITCRNGRCVYPHWQCDGFNDCDDNSDEENCITVETTSPSPTTLPPRTTTTASAATTTTLPTTTLLATKTTTLLPTTKITSLPTAKTSTTVLPTKTTTTLLPTTKTTTPTTTLLPTTKTATTMLPTKTTTTLLPTTKTTTTPTTTLLPTTKTTTTMLPTKTTTTLLPTTKTTTMLPTKTTTTTLLPTTKTTTPTTTLLPTTKTTTTTLPTTKTTLLPTQLPSGGSTPVPASTTASCKSYEYRCGNGRCVFTTWKCDGFDDCGDFSDETGCGKPATTRLSLVSTESTPTLTTPGLTQTMRPRCPGSRFACKALGNIICLPRSWTCDGEYDCDDGVDENSCYETTTTVATTRSILICEEGQFKCMIRKDWRCISGSLVCNGFFDCHDGTDELFCGPRTSSTMSTSPRQSTFTAAKITSEKLPTTSMSPGQSTFTTAKIATSETTQLSSSSSPSPATTTRAATAPAIPTKPTHKIPTPTKTTTAKKATKTTMTMKTSTPATHISTTTKRTCFPNSFICESSKQCIPVFLICDGRNDCPDGSDEKHENCKAPETCGTSVIPPTIERKRIVGGRVAIPGSWPWMATMRLRIPRRGHMCGATLISSQWLLTATHCFAGKYVHPWRWTVHLGKITRDGNSSIEQVFEPKVIVTHDGYNPLTSENDIALVKLYKPVQMTARVSPVCLPGKESQPLRAGQYCFVAGFGETRGTGGQGRLKQTSLRVMGVRQCNNTIRYNGRISGKMFCAEDRVGRSDACQGDSGGGFFCLERGHQFVARGVTSWGDGCASQNKPGVYTDVHKYIDWIIATIRAN